MVKAGEPAIGAHISDLTKEAQPPVKGILSRTIFNDQKVKVVIFGFAQDEELSEHTASMPAILHILSGTATLTLGGQTHQAQSGTWVHMPAHLPQAYEGKLHLISPCTVARRRLNLAWATGPSQCP